MAINFGCDLYYLTPANTLTDVDIYNANYLEDTDVYILAPNKELDEGAIINQYWELNPYRDMRLFIKCTYKNNYSKVKEIPDTVNMCKLTFVDKNKIIHSPKSPGFSCYKNDEK